MAAESTQSSPPSSPVIQRVPTKLADWAGKEPVKRPRTETLRPDDKFRYARPSVPLCFGAFSAIAVPSAIWKNFLSTHEYVPLTLHSSFRNACTPRSPPQSFTSPTFR